MVLIFSCKKLDVSVEADKGLEKFFKYTGSTKSVIENAINKLKMLDSENPFVKTFSEKEGFPVWDKAKVSFVKKNLSRGENNESDTIVTVPVVPENSKYVKDLLKIKLNGELYFKLIKGEEYALYGFDKNTEPSKLNADKLAIEIMAFEKELFNNELYRIKDTRLFDYWASEEVKPEEFFVSAKKERCTNFIEVYDVRVGGELTSCPPGKDHCFELVQVLVAVIPIEGWCDDGGDGGWGNDDEGWTNSPLPEEGGGGGGNENGTPIYTPGSSCNVGWSPVKQTIYGELFDLCENALVVIEKPNAEGFYQSRIDFLTSILKIEPFSITPCDEIIALGQYGRMFQDVASYEVPTIVKDRLNLLRNQHPSVLFVDDYNLQYIEKAEGAVVNCDFFPLKISRLPFKSPGVRSSPKEFLEMFRKNINNFIDLDVNVNFSCTFPWYDDCTKWNTPFEGSLGALNSIKIGLIPPLYNSGSIIISDYKSETRPDGYQHYWFTFSTLETPFDSEHPVAGNRKFGIYNTVQNPNEWTFYIMGVDRTWDLFFGLGNFRNFGFNKGDELWKSVQQNLISYINSPTAGGESTFYSRRSYISRPSWEDVKRFLKKEISFTQLKISLGC